MILGPGGPVSLMMSSVNLAMQDYNVPEDERIEFSINVRKLAVNIFKLQAEEAEEKRKKTT